MPSPISRADSRRRSLMLPRILAVAALGLALALGASATSHLSVPGGHPKEIIDRIPLTPPEGGWKVPPIPPVSNTLGAPFPGRPIPSAPSKPLPKPPVVSAHSTPLSKPSGPPVAADPQSAPRSILKKPSKNKGSPKGVGFGDDVVAIAGDDGNSMAAKTTIADDGNTGFSFGLSKPIRKTRAELKMARFAGQPQREDEKKAVANANNLVAELNRNVPEEPSLPKISYESLSDSENQTIKNVAFFLDDFDKQYRSALDKPLAERHAIIKRLELQLMQAGREEKKIVDQGDRFTVKKEWISPRQKALVNLPN